VGRDVIFHRTSGKREAIQTNTVKKHMKGGDTSEYITDNLGLVAEKGNFEKIATRFEGPEIARGGKKKGSPKV